MTRIEDQLRREKEKSCSIQEIARAIGSTLDLDDLLRLIVSKITHLMDAERSTLYVIDETRQTLWTKVLQADELREFRLNLGEGVAGWVAAAGQTASIEDAYTDHRFLPALDRISGFRTRSILCAPMKDNQGHIIGVVEVLNKKAGAAFTPEDQELLEALAGQAGIAIENGKLYQAVLQNNERLRETQYNLERRVRELDLLREIERCLIGTTSVEELLEQLLQKTAELVEAEAASILIHDEKSERLFFRTAIGERREAVKQVSVSTGQGIAGWVAKHQQPVRVSNPAGDGRHDSNLAEKIGFHPRNILCVPLCGSETVRGAIELLNKIGREQFDEGDERLLTIIAGQAAQAIELARVKEQRLLEARLAEVGQLLSGVLHDLKTPMTIALGYARLMAESEARSERETLAGEVMRQFDVMSQMTKEVLAFARGESNLLVRKVFLNKFLKEMSEHLRQEFSERNIELVLLQRYEGSAYFDEAKFRRVFHNIGRNAAQAMPDGGRFEIEVDALTDQLVFRFRDTGCGIPPELEGRLFGLFASAGKQEGTGLGLAIVRKIVEEHNGQISYESKARGGTTFVVQIPLSPPPPLVSGAAPKVSA